MTRASVLAALALVACTKDKPAPAAEPAACKDPFAPATDDDGDAEVQVATAKVDLPAVPAFEVPAPHPDGARTVKELKVAGNRLDGQDLTVRGVVVSTDGDRFWLADTATDHPSRWIVVMDVSSDPKLAVGDAVVVTGTGQRFGALGYTSVAPYR